LQRARELLGAVLVSQRLAAERVLTLKFEHEHLAVDQRAPPLPRRLLAVAFCHQAIFRGHHTMLGGFRALLCRPPTLTGGPHDDVRAGEPTRTVSLLLAQAGLGDRDVAGGGCLVARECRDIAGVSDRVTLLGDMQPGLSGLIAPVASALALTRGAFADALGDVVLLAVTAGRQVVIARGLIAVGSHLIALGVRLVAVGARLIDVGQRLIAVRRGLVGSREKLREVLRVLEKLRRRSAAVLRSPVHAAHGTIILTLNGPQRASGRLGGRSR
jgi:hypothetical protein